jgi:hypothetical protein
MPKDLPDVLAKIKWTKTAKEVDNWDIWLVHTSRRPSHAYNAYIMCYQVVYARTHH